MPNVAHVLREEIQRLARKQVKAGVSPVKRETVRLKKIVADLRRQLTAMSQTNQALLTKVAALVASQLLPRPGILQRVRYTLDVLDLPATLASVRISSVIAMLVLGGRGRGETGPG